jgi:2-isopropylmalate synthase
LRVADKLDNFGIHYIEGGWPGSNPKDIEFFQIVKTRKFKTAKIAAFGSTRRKGVPVEEDHQVNLLLESEAPVVTIFGKHGYFHVISSLMTTPSENLYMSC